MIIDGKKIAEDLRQNLKKEISNLKTNIKYTYIRGTLKKSFQI